MIPGIPSWRLERPRLGAENPRAVLDRPCRGVVPGLSDPMEAPSGLGGAVPVPASQVAKKEWRAIPEHSFRSNGSEVRFNGV